MKRLLAIASAAAALLCTNLSVHAQEKVHYRTATFVTIAPDKQAEALDFVRTVGIKLAQENINSGRLTSWSLLRTAYAGVGTDYNFIQVTTFDGPPAPELSPEARDQMYRRVIGMSYQDYQKKLTSFLTSGNSVLSRIEASVDGPPAAVGSLVRVSRWKITAGRGTDYANYIKTKVQPLNAEGVKEGVFQSWSASRAIFPSGDDVSYDATTSNIYKDMAQVLSPPPANPNQGAPAAFAKIFPDKSYAAFVDEGRQLRHLVRAELWRVVAVAGPAAR
ncbi:MAG TPA: hypothetical protein VFI23_08780 [Rhizomicrobium sp.]|nr:hypothetical protein [Rhizomicrobium sp.]